MPARQPTILHMYGCMFVTFSLSNWFIIHRISNTTSGIISSVKSKMSFHCQFAIQRTELNNLLTLESNQPVADVENSEMLLIGAVGICEKCMGICKTKCSQ